jgi:hypothetical protein
MINASLFRYILKAAARDKFFLSAAVLMVVVTCLSFFFGSSVVTEQDQFARSFAAFGFRLFGVVCLVLFVVAHIRRSFETRDVDSLLSRPLTRPSFILTHAAAFSMLAIILVVMMGGLGILFQLGALHGGIFIWWGSVALEFIIMANVALFFALVMSSFTACAGIIFAFYLLSRLMGEILGILAKGGDSGVMLILNKVMTLISIVIPRFDLMGQTQWIVHETPTQEMFLLIFGHGVVFTVLVILAAMIDLRRRQF